MIGTIHTAWIECTYHEHKHVTLICLPLVKDLDKNRAKEINSIKDSVPHWPELDLTTSGTHSSSSEWF